MAYFAKGTDRRVRSAETQMKLREFIASIVLLQNVPFTVLQCLSLEVIVVT